MRELIAVPVGAAVKRLPGEGKFALGQHSAFVHLRPREVGMSSPELMASIVACLCQLRQAVERGRRNVRADGGSAVMTDPTVTTDNLDQKCGSIRIAAPNEGVA